MTPLNKSPNIVSLIKSLGDSSDRLKHGDNFPNATEIRQLNQAIGALPNMTRPQPDLATLLPLIQHQVVHISKEVQFQQVGTVQQIGNGVARLSGLPAVRTEEVVTFPTGVQGLVLSLNRTSLEVILLGSAEGIQGGDLVTSSGERLRVPVGPKLLGRVVNALGQPLDEKGPVDALAFHFLEQEAPGIIERSPVSEPLHTGLKIIDALVPIGRGQRELILGSRQTGKTTLAVDTILNQHDSGVKCVYVAVGRKKSSTLKVIETLRQASALAYTTVVMSSPDDPPALRYLAPYAGCTIAEFLMRQGQDVLIVYDDLSKHADAYRELSLLLRRPPGREAYPGDIFYLHARLLERACQLNSDLGGGSLTALPIVQTQRGNISAYIPTNLISITDGQIVLDAERFNQGLKPALDVGLSVSRVGGAAQTPAMRAVAGSLRLELAQFEEVAHFTRFGAEVDKTTQHQIQRGRRLQAVLSQPAHHPLSLAKQVAILWAASQGYLDDVARKTISDFETDLLSHLEAAYPDLLRQIDHGGELTSPISDELQKAIADFQTHWVETRHDS